MNYINQYMYAIMPVYHERNLERHRFPNLSSIIASPDRNCASQSSGFTAVGFSTRTGLDFCEFLITPCAGSGAAVSPCVDGVIAGFVALLSFILLGPVCWRLKLGAGESKASLSHCRSSVAALL